MSNDSKFDSKGEQHVGLVRKAAPPPVQGEMTGDDLRVGDTVSWIGNEYVLTERDADGDWHGTATGVGQHTERGTKGMFKPYMIRAREFKLVRRAWDYDSSFDRLSDIVDEEFGRQPVMPPAELMTTLSRELFESRQGNAAELARLRGALEAVRAGVSDYWGSGCKPDAIANIDVIAAEALKGTR